ncbi:MAG TPA: hypothetical protein VM598_09825 [Bdellovibrionota bacterium]|nr:hypothetical protein [Bdellovibrionota bacterium]
MVRKRKISILCVLSAWGAFLPVLAFAQQPAAAPAAQATQCPSTGTQLEYIQCIERERAAITEATERQRLSTLSGAELTAARQKLEQEANNQRIRDEARAAAEREQAALPAEGDRTPKDIDSWDDLKKIVPNIKLVVDKAAGGDYAASVHLEGSIPTHCIASTHLTGGRDAFVKPYTLATRPRIASLDNVGYPFSGYRVQTSKALEACVQRFKDDGRRCSAAVCTDLKSFPKITDLAGGPRVGFYACEGEDSDCKVAFFNEGKSDKDVPRIANATAFNQAKRLLDDRTKTVSTGLALWKIKHSCYEKKSEDLPKLFTEIAALKAKLKNENFAPYARRGLNAEIERLKSGATSKPVSELRAHANIVTDFFNRYLTAGSRSGLPDPDLDRMRREVMNIYRTMEFRVLDDPSADRNPENAKTNAEEIIRQALSLEPMDEGLRRMFRNELERGIKIDVHVLKVARKNAAFTRAEQSLAAAQQELQQAIASRDPVAIQSAQQKVIAAAQRRQVALQAAFKTAGPHHKMLQDLVRDQAKACTRGRRAATAEDAEEALYGDEGLIVDGGGEAEDLPTFNSRCEAATDNLKRIQERVTEATQAATQSTQSNQVIAQLAQAIVPGATNLPNATIQPGQNGYNPALAYALKIPGNFDQTFLDNLAPRLQPSTEVLGMCRSGAGGQIVGCVPQQNVSTLPAPLPVARRL